MPTIQIRFPAGRYHATPSGSHVNEGHVEWPPSPWRLLRALVACGFNTQHWTEVPENARRLITKLANQPPMYWLPAVSMAHSRHYMPVGGIDSSGREKTTLVFDTWADVGDSEVRVHWDCELDEEEKQLLSRLVNCLGYLGRSESWIEAKLIESNEFDFNTYPFDANNLPKHGCEQIHVLGPAMPDEYSAWYQRKTEALISDIPTPEKGLKATSKASKDLAKARSKAIEPYPRDFIECLTKDTAWWKDRKWASPPGSRLLLYWRPANQMLVSPPSRPRASRVQRVSSILLAMSTRSGNRASLPPITRTLPQAELLHRQLVGAVTKSSNLNCPELTGCDATKRPLRLPHQHAHILPLDLDSDGHLDHILIHAPMGLGADAQRAIRTIRRTFAKNVAEDLQLAVAGIGSPLRLLEAAGATSLVSSGTVWTTVTPLVLPRYLKKTGKNSLEGQVQAELASRGLQPADSIELLKKESIAFRHFIRVRRNGSNPPRPPIDVGYALTLRFKEPLSLDQLPLSLGYGSHFGLGLFRGIEKQ